MKRLQHILGRQEGGQALVEFALVAIVFFILVLGMIDVGRAVSNYNTLAQATREGTRYAIVHGAYSSDPSGPGDTDEIVDTVEQFAAGLDLTRLNVSAEWPDGTNAVGNRATVTSSYTFDPFFDFLGIVSFSMTSSSTMEIRY
jgi:Flp pilus assembly protein TadG